MTNVNNKVQVIGTISNISILTNNTDLRCVEFIITTNTLFFDQTGNSRKEKTTHKCIAWNKQAIVFEKNVTIGSIIAIEGVLVSPASYYFKYLKSSTIIQVNDLLILNKQ